MKIIISLIVSCFTFTLLAQQPIGIDALKPKIPQTKNKGKLIEPEKPSAPPVREQAFLDSLKGLVFVSDIKKIKSSRIDQAGIKLESIYVRNPEEFKRIIGKYLGKPVSLKLLDSINKEVVSYLSSDDYMIVDSFVPKGQDVTNGVVQIVILVGNLGEIKSQNAKYFSGDKIVSHFRAEDKKPIRRSVLMEDIEWVNNNPFREVNVLLEKGESYGESNLVLDVNDRRPVRVYVGAEDSGTVATGENRYIAGFNWGNAFGLDHIMSYQYTRSFESGLTDAHGFSYLAPLPWRHNLSLSISYVEADPPADIFGFNLDGETTQINLRYQIPFKNIGKFSHALNLDYDFKRSNNNLLFGDLTVFQTFTNIHQWSVGYEGAYEASAGVLNFNTDLVYSPGGIGSDNEDAAFSASRFGATADYYYAKLNVSWTQDIYKGFEWVSEISAQQSNVNLLGSEQIGAGGFRSVRGYDEFQTIGDKGVIFRNEIYTPGFSIFKLFGAKKKYDNMKLLTFVDYGTVESEDALPGETSTSLFSVGAGLRWNIASNFSMRFDYGWQLREATAGADKDHQGHWGVILSY